MRFSDLSQSPAKVSRAGPGISGVRVTEWITENSGFNLNGAVAQVLPTTYPWS